LVFWKSCFFRFFRHLLASSEGGGHNTVELGKARMGPGREAANARSCGRQPAVASTAKHTSREAATATRQGADVAVEMECLRAAKSLTG